MSPVSSLDVVERMILDQPGGEWILPHWQEGPYWLVPIDPAGTVPYDAQVIKEAHEPVLPLAPAFDGIDVVSCSVHAFSKYAWAVVQANEYEDEGLRPLWDNLVGPLDAPPTPADVLAALPTLLGTQDAKLASHKEQIDAALAVLLAADPALVLPTLSALTPAQFSWVDDGENLAAILTAAAGVVIDA